jgi:methionyl aminopeptidase
MNRIPIKTEAELDGLRQSARLLAKAFRSVEPHIKQGTTTKELNDLARETIVNGNGEPAFKGYQGYPADICVSINEEVVHGIPDARKIREGDIVSLDMGVNLDGYFSDAAKTYAVGTIPQEAADLMETTREAVHRGIRQCRSGGHVSDISHAIQFCAESRGFSVVRSLVGHGIGKALHEEPQIPNYGPPHRGALLKPGMVFAIEAMINRGGYRVRTKEDGWTVETEDGLPSAHFEHTIVITDSRPEVLTAEIEDNGGTDISE